MKKAITLILVSFISFGLTAQMHMDAHLSSFQINNQEAMLPHFPATPKGNSSLNQSQNYKQRLDSLIEESYEETSQQWLNLNRETYKYDDYGNTIEHFYYTWNIATSEWVPNGAYQYSYDENGNQTLNQYNLIWNDDLQQWDYGYRNEYTYDENDMRLSTINYNWNIDSWELDVMDEYIYENDILIRIDRYDWNNSEWLLSYKYEYAYDANDNISSRTRYSWDDYTETWTNSFLYEYEHSPNGLLLSYTGYSWDTSLQQWDEGYKYELEYDSNDNQTLFVIYDWNEFTESWEASSKSEYIHDANQNYITYHSSNWDTNTDQWINNYKNNYSYDNTYSYNELIVPYSEFVFRHKRTSQSRDDWDTNTNQWITNTRRGTYHYSEQLVGIENVVQAGIHIFPNPATNQVFFDLPSANQAAHIQLYDAQGKLADIQPLIDNKISVKHLNTGVYFYQLFHDDRQYGGTLMVNKP